MRENSRSSSFAPSLWLIIVLRLVAIGSLCRPSSGFSLSTTTSTNRVLSSTIPSSSTTTSRFLLTKAAATADDGSDSIFTSADDENNNNESISRVATQQSPQNSSSGSSRRTLLFFTATTITSSALFFLHHPSTSLAMNILQVPLQQQQKQQQHSQLEYCLVSLLRVVAFCQTILQEFQDCNGDNNKNTDDDDTRRRSIYLEARLGAKALLTGKIGSGATGRVYQLSTLRFTDTLKDLAYYTTAATTASPNSNTRLRDSSLLLLLQDLQEALASLVEFDGLDTLTDPSPRSSLTLSQYTPDKAVFVQRTLQEKVIPLCQRIGNYQYYAAGGDTNDTAREIANRYMQAYYAEELPPQPSIKEKQ